jgi:hypothetical protein
MALSVVRAKGLAADLDVWKQTKSPRDAVSPRAGVEASSQPGRGARFTAVMLRYFSTNWAIRNRNTGYNDL